MMMKVEEEEKREEPNKSQVLVWETGIIKSGKWKRDQSKAVLI